MLLKSLLNNDEIQEAFNPSEIYSFKYKGTKDDKEKKEEMVIPLHIACAYGRSDIVRYFLASGLCDVNCYDKKNNTALHILAKKNYGYSSVQTQIEISKMLVSAGAKLYAQNRKGNTPAHEALYEQNIDLFNEMMEFGESIRIVLNNAGDTLLHAAICGSLSHRDLQIVVTNLIKKDPDFLVCRNKRGFSPMMSACITKESEHLDILTNAHFSSLQMRSSNEKYTLLHIAVLSNNLKAVEWLLMQNDQDALFFQSSVDSHGQTPLHLVRNLECVKVLFTNGYDMNVLDSEGNTLLHTIVQDPKGHFPYEEKKALMKFLVNECDVNCKNLRGLTALQLAWKKEQFGLVKLMISIEGTFWDILDFNDSGDSLLHLCLLQFSQISNEIITELCKSTGYQQYTNKNMETPAHVAAAHSSPEILSLFEDYTSSFNSEGMNPFQVAVRYRSVDIIKCILAFANPDFSAKTTEGLSVLHIAAAENTVEVVNYLLAFVDINVTNEQHEVPLHAAVKSSNYSVIEFLLKQKNCDPCWVNIHGITPINIASYSFNLKALELIFSHHPHLACLPSTVSGNTVLHLAAYSNNVIMLKHFFKKIDVNSSNRNLETPVFVAVQNSSVEATKFLVGIQGCRLNLRNATGDCPLHIALKQENASLISVLVESSGCDFEVKNRYGLTPLHYLATVSNVDIIRNIISKVLNKDGRSLLHLASKYNIQEIFKFVSTPSHINSLDGDQNTPLHIATMMGHKETISSILSVEDCDSTVLNKIGYSAFHLAVMSGDVHLVEALLKSGRINPSELSRNKCTALHICVIEGKLEMLQFLLAKHFIDVNLTNEDGDTPLHVAIGYGKLAMVELIGDMKRCSLKQTDKVGNTPLHLTCLLKDKETSLEIARILLRMSKGYEVRPNCINKAGKTPAQLATENYGILHELSSFLDITTHKKLENFVKILVVGKATVGKSHLIEAIAIDAKNNFKTRRQKIKQVSKLTAGIVPKQIYNKNFGHAVLYEFAGQPEYYDSNSAILDNLVLSSPPLFLVVVSLNSTDKIILEDICYWLKFIENQCAVRTENLTTVPHVILALSYFDVFKKTGRSLDDLLIKVKQKISSLVQSTKFEFCDYSISALDCRMLASAGLKILNYSLSQACQVLRVEENDDFMSTYLNAFLKDKFSSHVALQVKDIESTIKNDKFLTQDMCEVMRLMSTLHDKDQILLLRNHNNPKDSWIIFDKNAIMSDIQGSIFSPQDFDNHSELAQSTGVVPLSRIKEYFKDYDSHMVIGVLSHLEYCSLIKDPKAYSLITKEHPTLRQSEYYFFPSLVKASAPPKDEMWIGNHKTLKYGWLYQTSTTSTELCLNRLMHVLILRIAFTFALGSSSSHPNSPVLCRRCSVWKHGIAWLKSGIQVVVEFCLQNNWISVILKLNDDSNELRIQGSQLLYELSTVIVEAKNEFCAPQEMSQYLIAQECVDYPMECKIQNHEDQIIKFAIEDVATSVINNTHTSGYVESFLGKEGRKISTLLPFEPFMCSSNRLINHILYHSYPARSIDINKIEQEFIEESQFNLGQKELIGVFFSLFRKTLPHSNAIPVCLHSDMMKFFKKYSIFSKELSSKVC